MFVCKLIYNLFMHDRRCDIRDRRYSKDAKILRLCDEAYKFVIQLKS